MRSPRWFLAAGAVLAFVLMLAGCGSSSKSSSTSGAPSSTSGSTGPSTTSSSSGGAVEVTMKNLAFSPAAVHAKVGQTVEWTNDDSPAHNVTYVSGPRFTSSGTINQGAKFSIKVTQAGTVHYFCSIHPFMKATIVVIQ
jgi:plastocyanin